MTSQNESPWLLERIGLTYCYRLSHTESTPHSRSAYSTNASADRWRTLCSISPMNSGHASKVETAYHKAGSSAARCLQALREGDGSCCQTLALVKLNLTGERIGGGDADKACECKD